jgi:crotonobetainyl-CoA:carnitine CoA-transferase CaiB-like acyl-CoA transferase
MLLGDMGAEVIKIEEPERGDDCRSFGPFVDGWSSYFLGLNRNKKSVALDLKREAGKETLRRLIMRSDVLVENFRPGSLALLGFGYSQVHELNPALIYCSISGYGQTGPRAHLSGYDPVIQAECGLMSVTGFTDGPPTRIGVAITDYMAGLYAHQGILLALLERQRTGQGQHIDIALFDSMLSALAMPVGMYQATGVNPERVGNDHPSIAPYEVFQAKDGMVMICAGNDRLFGSLCEALGVPHLRTDPRFRTNADRVQHRSGLKAKLQTTIHELAVGELIARCEARSVPCGRVRTVGEALQDPQLQARSMLVDLDVPGHGRFSVLGNAVKMSDAPPVEPRRPPRLGEHTAVTLEALGMSVGDDGQPQEATVASTDEPSR